MARIAASASPIRLRRSESSSNGHRQRKRRVIISWASPPRPGSAIVRWERAVSNSPHRAFGITNNRGGCPLNVADDLRRIALQEERLRFETFGPETAWRLGTWLRDAAVARRAPIAIDIQAYGMPLFFCAHAGQHAGQRRLDSAQTEPGPAHVRQFVRDRFETRPARDDAAGADGTSAPRLRQPRREFSHLLVNGSCIGAITVSGLPQRQDHDLVVEALAAERKLDLSEIALPDE